MDYIKQNLGKGEKIVSKAEVDTFLMIPTVLTILPVVICYIEISRGFSLSSVSSGIIILTLVLLGQYYRIKSVELAITDNKLIGKSGLFIPNSIEICLDKIDSISVTETIDGKLFGYATLQISAAYSKIKFPYIACAVDYKNDVLEQIELYTKNRNNQ